MPDPLCFVLMPFGQKREPSSGKLIDFDRIYDEAVRPAIIAAGLEPIRADEERTGGIIHKPMFERLMLCDYAVADLTTANANVFYELGIRHAVRPSTTLAIFAAGFPLPFDVNLLRALPYSVGDDLSMGSGHLGGLLRDLTNRLVTLRDTQATLAAADSPIFQLLTDYRAPDVAHLKTDVFRERSRYAADVKNALAVARRARDTGALNTIAAGLGPIVDAEAGVVVDLFLSYRAVSAWQSMIDLYQEMSITLQRAIMMREQLGFALNRAGRREDASSVLEDILDEQGPTSETCGLLGRIQKDLWSEQLEAGNFLIASGYLSKAIEMYRLGFEADPRDAYPGINAATLLEIKGDEEALAERTQIVAVVRFAVERRIKYARPDYWDYATLLELAVLAEDRKEAARWLTRTLAAMREPWEAETTANNLRFIRNARAGRRVAVDWLDQIIGALGPTLSRSE